MRRVITWILSAIILSAFSVTLGCEDGEHNSADMKINADGSNILIAYFSCNDAITEETDTVTSATPHPNDTSAVAKMIQQHIGGDLFQIVTQKKYPNSYSELLDDSKNELMDNERPELSNSLESAETYNIIFICYPNWWNTVPMAVLTFLEQNNFSGKTILPLCTHGGGGIGDSVRDIEKSCSESKVLEGLAISGRSIGSSEKKIEKWLQEAGKK